MTKDDTEIPYEEETKGDEGPTSLEQKAGEKGGKKDSMKGGHTESHQILGQSRQALESLWWNQIKNFKPDYPSKTHDFEQRRMGIRILTKL